MVDTVSACKVHARRIFHRNTFRNVISSISRSIREGVGGNHQPRLQVVLNITAHTRAGYRQPPPPLHHNIKPPHNNKTSRTGSTRPLPPPPDKLQHLKHQDITKPQAHAQAPDERSNALSHKQPLPPPAKQHLNIRHTHERKP